jgi:hypothetical protein
MNATTKTQSQPPPLPESEAELQKGYKKAPSLSPEKKLRLNRPE